jgi:tetratricopeptide (TPR) repeat protein
MVGVLTQNESIEVIIGKRLEKEGKYYAAIWHYDRAIKLNPNNPNIHFFKGEALLNKASRGLDKKDFESTIEQFKIGLEILEKESVIQENNKMIHEIRSKIHLLKAVRLWLLEDHDGALDEVREVESASENVDSKLREIARIIKNRVSEDHDALCKNLYGQSNTPVIDGNEERKKIEKLKHYIEMVRELSLNG